MKLNLLDRALLQVDPVRVARRVHARAQVETALAFSALAGGDGGTASASGGSRWWLPRARDARSDTLSKLPLQRGQSRELARTSPIAVGAINTNIDRVVGTGLALSAQPNRAVLGWSEAQASDWKRQVQAEFSLWADSTDCDQTQTQNFYELQALVLRAVLESGDCFTLLPDGERSAAMPYALRLQVLEADRVGNPLGVCDSALMAGGIRLAASGAPEAFHIYDSHPGAGLSAAGKPLAGQWVDRLGRSGRRRVLQHLRKLRPDMPRGVPYLAPIVELIKQISRYTEAEISAAVISAFFTVFIEGAPNGNPAPVFQGEEGADQPDADIGMGMGAVVGLAPGEKASFADPSRPNPNFDGFVKAMLGQVGMALSIPLELLLKQFNSSYSASKAALLDAWIYFRSVRTWLARSFCQPVYETLLAEAVAIGRIPAPGFFADPLLRWAYTRASWHGDSMGSINPKDEVAAYLAAVDGRLMTRERAEWELFSSDWNDTLDQKAAEQRLLAENDLLPAPKAGAAAPAQPAAPATPNQEP